MLVVVLIHLAGGWVFANGFRQNALKVRGPARDWGIWVKALARGRVVLTAAEPNQKLGHPGTIGVYWENGYGRVGDVVAISGLEVTRSFSLVEGEPPPTCPEGPLEECDPVDLESYAYPNDPSDVGLDFSNIEYRGPLGSMGGWVVPAGSGSRWAIHIHGWTAERREAIRALPPLHASGVTSMVIDYRNDPGAPADPSGHYRFGLSEWQDVEAAVGHAIDRGAREIILVGYSTGAAHAMSFLERSDLHERVIALVFDSPNIVLAETVRHGSHDLRFPRVRIRMSQLMIEFGMWIADLRWDIDWENTNYVQRAESIIDVPTLVFHGTSDRGVPISESRQLEARLGDLIRLVETPAAGHVMSWNADPKRYEGYLSGFLSAL